jgi:hypothetical protein
MAQLIDQRGAAIAGNPGPSAIFGRQVSSCLHVAEQSPGHTQLAGKSLEQLTGGEGPTLSAPAATRLQTSARREQIFQLETSGSDDRFDVAPGKAVD